MTSTVDRIANLLTEIDPDQTSLCPVSIYGDARSGRHIVEGATITVELERGYSMVTMRLDDSVRPSILATTEIGSTSTKRIVDAIERMRTAVKVLARVHDDLESAGYTPSPGTELGTSTLSCSGLRFYDEDYTSAKIFTTGSREGGDLFVEAGRGGPNTPVYLRVCETLRAAASEA